MSSARRAAPEPAHAVGQARRREPDLGVAGSPRRPRRGRRRRPTRQSSKTTSAWPPGKARSMASMTRSIRQPGLSASTRNIVAPPRRSRCAMQIAKAAPSAPVMNHLRPLIDQPPSTRSARGAGASTGSEPAPGAGSVIAKHERDLAARQRPQVPLALLGRGDQRRAGACCPRRGPRSSAPAARAGCSRPPRRPPRCRACRGPRPPSSGGTCGANTPASLGGGLQLGAQLRRRGRASATSRASAGIDDRRATNARTRVAQLRDLGRDGEVDHRAAPAAPRAAR